MKILHLVILCVGIGTSTNAIAEEFKYKFDRIDVLEVENSSGEVRVTSTEDLAQHEVSLLVNKKRFGKNCELKVKKSLRAFKISIKERRTGNNGLNESCVVDLNFKLSANIPINTLKVENGFGPLVVHRNIDVLNFKVGAGQVDLRGNFKTLRGNGGDAPVELKGSVEHALVNLGSGSFKYIAPKRELISGAINVKTGLGDAQFSLHPDQFVVVDYNSPFGSFQSALKNSVRVNKYKKLNKLENSLKVKFSAGSGSLRLRSSR